MRPLLLLAAVGLIAIAPAKAESLVLGEANSVGKIVSGYGAFTIVNGHAPTSWAEIETMLSQPLDRADGNLKPTIRYAFLKEPVPILDGGRLVILSRSPFHSEYKMRGFWGPITGNLDTALMRYGVVVSPDGAINAVHLREPQVQHLFASQKIALPDPDPLGPRPYETANRFALYALIGGAFLFIAYMGYVIRRKSKLQASLW